MPSKKEIEKALKKEIEIQTVEDKMKEDASWEVGVNKREKAKTQKEIQKQEEKLMKNQKLAELIEEEAANLKNIPRPKTSYGRKRDLGFLDETLKNAPKTKAEKEKEHKEKEKERRKQEDLRKQLEKQEREKKQEKEDYLLSKQNIVRQELTINTQIEPMYDEDAIYATGVDNAIDAFKVTSIKQTRKNAFMKFYNKHLEDLKEKCPQLKLSKYKERIEKMWKVSNENPDNKI